MRQMESQVEQGAGPVFIRGRAEWTYIRGRLVGGRPQPFPPWALGPKPPDHPSIGVRCAACGRQFVVGDVTALVALGPGPDAEDQKRAREGRWGNLVALEIHWACATGHDVPDGPWDEAAP